MGLLSSKENLMESRFGNPLVPVPWNKGRLAGQWPPSKLQEIWAIRIRLQLAGKACDPALFNLAIGCNKRQRITPYRLLRPASRPPRFQLARYDLGFI
jgi:hypothetical protein